MQEFVEGSSYFGTLVADYFTFRDELAKFQAQRDNDLRKEKYFAIFGCAYEETGTFHEQEADGILGLGLGTNCSLLLNSNGQSTGHSANAIQARPNFQKPIFTLFWPRGRFHHLWRL